MSVQLEFRWSEEVYVMAGEITYRYKMTHSWQRYAGWFFVSLMLFGALTIERPNGYALLYVGTIMSVYWFFIKGFLYKSRLKHSFKKEAMEKLTMHFDITKGGVNINGNMIAWNQISLVILHPQGFLLERPEGYPYLPATAFKSDKDVEYFFALIDRNDIPLVRVS